MELAQFLESQIDTLQFLPPRCQKIVEIYLDGLVRGHKKSVKGIIREFQLHFTTQFLLTHLKQLPAYSSPLKQHIYRQIRLKVDRRSKFFLAGDDTSHRVYGKKIYAAGIQYDHALNAFINSIKLVDLIVSDLKDRVLLNDFKVYMPKSFVATHSWQGYQFRSKIDLLSELMICMIQTMNEVAVPKKTIWVLVDSWFSSGKFEKRIRDVGANYVLQVKKDRRIRLFQTWMRIDQYFERYKSAHYFTAQPDKKKIFYKEAILDVSKFGRRKVIAFKEEQEKEWRYFVISELKLTAKTAYKYIKRRWLVETMHRETKQFFGLEATYSGRAKYLIAHYLCSYYGWLLFQWYKWQIAADQDYTSTEELWMQYIQERRRQEKGNLQFFLGKPKIPRRPLQKNVKFKNKKIPVEAI
ncbi:MAG: transposase [Candidatus Helarchaeota archaeon]|nr:transposase [Candidatus Helarchaeota archaeon]